MRIDILVFNVIYLFLSNKKKFNSTYMYGRAIPKLNIFTNITQIIQIQYIRFDMKIANFCLQITAIFFHK